MGHTVNFITINAPRKAKKGLIWIPFLIAIALIFPISRISADTADDVHQIASKNFDYIADEQVLEALGKESQAGNVMAQYELARQYERIQKKFPDKEITDSEIFELYEQSANAGYVPSQFTIGLMFAKGKYVSKDMASAYKWLSLAAQQGDEMSKSALQALESTMSPQEIDKAKELMKGNNQK